MLREKTLAFVLRKFPYRETGIIAVLFTEALGKVRVLVHGVRKDGAKIAPLWQVGTLLSLNLKVNPSRDLAYVEDQWLERPSPGLHAAAKTSVVMMTALGLVEAFSLERYRDDKLWRLVVALLSGLRDGVDPMMALHYFEIWCLRLHGTWPPLDSCKGCNRQMPAAAGGVYWLELKNGFYCQECHSENAGAAFDPADFEALQRSRRQSLPDWTATADFSEKTRVWLHSRINQTLEKPLESYRVLDSFLAYANGINSKNNSKSRPRIAEQRSPVAPPTNDRAPEKETKQKPKGE